MAVGKEIESRGHVLGFKEEISLAAASKGEDFFTWFDTAQDKDSAFVRGSWDFLYHIAHPSIRYISKPEDKVALEIGYGGGRILAAASRHFKTVIGVDVHDQRVKVEDEMKKRGIYNTRLLQTGGMDIPVEDGSVDFAYSFIVFQHLEKIEVFRKYIREIYRVLKTDGIAVLYFGRKAYFSENTSRRMGYILDCLLERVWLPKGFQEIQSRVNDINLLISHTYAKSFVREVGFEVLKRLVSRKKVPDGVKLLGSQNGLVLRKK